jgi:sugar phosphate isomerase/epimerase
MTPCISQATTLSTSFADDVAGYAAGGCPAIELWLTKLEKHLETATVAETRALLADRGLAPAAAAYQGGLLLSQGDARKAHFDHFRRRLDLCQGLGVPTLVLVADFAQAAPDAAALGRAVVSLAQAAQWAAGYGVRLALEFRGPDTFCSCLDTALSLVEQCREPNVGVCLDVFHYYKGSSKPEDLDRLTAANLAHVQVCDVAGVPRELMTDADRVFPGDGDFRLEPIVRKLREIGYAGFVSLELMNPVLWQSKPSQVAELGTAALRRLLGE